MAILREYTTPPDFGVEFLSALLYLCLRDVLPESISSRKHSPERLLALRRTTHPGACYAAGHRPTPLSPASRFLLLGTGFHQPLLEAARIFNLAKSRP